jgi:hypothetical protein
VRKDATREDLPSKTIIVLYPGGGTDGRHA